MPQVRGTCGHPKATWDNHPNCLSCSRCSVDNRCDICAQWSTTTWHCAIFRRTYSARSKMSKDSKDKKKKSGSRHRSRKSSSGVRSSGHRSSERELLEGGGELDKGNSPTSPERRHAGDPPGARLDRDSPGDRSDHSSGSSLEEIQHKEPPSGRDPGYGDSNGNPAGFPVVSTTGLAPSSQTKLSSGRQISNDNLTGYPAGNTAGHPVDRSRLSKDPSYSSPMVKKTSGHQYVSIPSEFDSVYTGSSVNSSIDNSFVNPSAGPRYSAPAGLNLNHTITTDQCKSSVDSGMLQGPPSGNPGVGFNPRCPTFSTSGMRLPIPGSQNSSYVFSAEKNIMVNSGQNTQQTGFASVFPDPRLSLGHTRMQASVYPPGLTLGQPYGYNFSDNVLQRQSSYSRQFSDNLRAVTDSQGNTIFVRDNVLPAGPSGRKSRFDDFHSFQDRSSSSSAERSHSRRKAKKKHKKHKKSSHRHASTSPSKQEASKDTSPSRKRKRSSSRESSPNQDQISIVVSNNEFDGESDGEPSRKSRTGLNSSKDSQDHVDTEDSEQKLSYSDIIQEVFKLLPVDICPPSDAPLSFARPRSSIERLKPAEEKQVSSLPQSLLVSDICSSISKHVDNPKSDSKFKPNWLVSKDFISSLGTKMKYYNLHKTVFPLEAPPLDSDASILDLAVPSQINTSSKFLETMENRARNIVSINSYSDLFAAAAFSSLGSENMDTMVLSKLLESLVNCVKHSTNLAVVMATELMVSRREAAINNSKILSQSAIDSLRKVSLMSNTLFGGQVATIQKANSEAITSKFIASSVVQKSKEKKSSQEFKIPKLTPKKVPPKKEVPKPFPAPRRGGGSFRGSRGGAPRGRGRQFPSHSGASKPKSN